MTKYQNINLTSTKVDHLYNLACYSGILVYLLSACLFFIAKLHLFGSVCVLFGIISGLYLFVDIRPLRLIVVNAHVQVISLVIMSTVGFGFSYGTHLLLFCTIALCFLSPFKKYDITLFFGLSEIVVYLVLFVLYSDVPPTFILPDFLMKLIYMGNFVVSASIILYVGRQSELIALFNHRNLEKDYLKYVELSQTDDLTGIFNRRYMNEYLMHLHENTMESFYVLFYDIDNFKEANQKSGHRSGDEVLTQVSKVLVDGGDCVVGRWGGDEFIVVLMKEELADAMNYYHRTTELLETRNLGVTVSVGCAHRKETLSLHRLLNLVDSRLNQAKANGKNRIIIE